MGGKIYFTKCFENGKKDFTFGFPLRKRYANVTQMLLKRNMKNPEKETRIVKIVPKPEIKEWRIFFQLRGSKALLHRKTGIPRKTINYILENEKGYEQTIKSIRTFLKTESQIA